MASKLTYDTAANSAVTDYSGPRNKSFISFTLVSVMVLGGSIALGTLTEGVFKTLWQWPDSLAFTAAIAAHLCCALFAYLSEVEYDDAKPSTWLFLTFTSLMVMFFGFLGAMRYHALVDLDTAPANAALSSCALWILEIGPPIGLGLFFCRVAAWLAQTTHLLREAKMLRSVIANVDTSDEAFRHWRKVELQAQENVDAVTRELQTIKANGRSPRATLIGKCATAKDWLGTLRRLDPGDVYVAIAMPNRLEVASNVALSHQYSNQ